MSIECHCGSPNGSGAAVMPGGRRTAAGARVRLIALAMTVLVAALVPGRAAAQATVDLELVLAVDASGSVDEQEFRLQLGGIAAAFRDPGVHNAIAAGINGRIAVAMVVWSDAHLPKDPSEWRVVSTPQEAIDFAALVETYPRRVRNGATGIGSGIAAGIQMMERNGMTGARRVVDVSGDGIETPLDTDVTRYGLLIEDARRLATDRKVTVNGLAILTDVPNLDEWYRREVRTGPGSFVMTASDYADFAQAIRAKLIREIEQGPPLSWLAPVE